jgi:hypothetical protein
LPSSDPAILIVVEPTISERYASWALEVARAAAAVANFCDHVDHNEPTDRAWVQDSGRTLRDTACAIASHEHLDLQVAYAARLRVIERRTPLWVEGALDGGALIEDAATWHELQLAQGEHDRRYHPDVSGLSKFDQLRHYSLHIMKLAGALAEVAQGPTDIEDFRARRLPDMVLFGIKLATVTGQRLPDTTLTARVDERLVLAS